MPVGFGTNAITVTATAAGGRSTGYAQVTVSAEGGGSTVLDATDPTGDDNGPGTYQYPTASDFVAGSFDLTRFQVMSDGTFAYLRVTLANLVPTFGALDGAQLLDFYVHVPGASSTSTQAAYASRNYTIAPSGAWSQRVEVQGFASPVWVNAAGSSVGTASALAVQADKTITMALPRRSSALRRPAGLQRGAGRPGRVQPRPGPRLHRHAGRRLVRGLRHGRDRADLLGRPVHRAQGHGRDHAAESRRRPSSTPFSAPWSSSRSLCPSCRLRDQPGLVGECRGGQALCRHGP